MRRTCADLREWLAPFLDDELAGADRKLFESHVASCADCSARLIAATRIQDAIRSDAEASEPPDAYFDELPERFEERFDLDAVRREWEERRQNWRAGDRQSRWSGLRRNSLRRDSLRWSSLRRSTAIRIALVALLAAVAAGIVREFDTVPMRPEERLSSEPVSDDHGLDLPSPAVFPEPPIASGEVAEWLRRLPGPEPPAERRADDRAPTERLDGVRAPAELPTGDGALTPPPAADAEPTAGSLVTTSMLLARERDDALPDELWAEGWRAAARSAADRALSGDAPERDGAEPCREALAAYWRMGNRAGRPVFPRPDALEAAFAPERPRIAALLRCLETP